MGHKNCFDFIDVCFFEWYLQHFGSFLCCFFCYISSDVIYFSCSRISTTNTEMLRQLPEGTLREKIEKLASSLSFPLKKLFVVDGSTRSSHSNVSIQSFTLAYFPFHSLLYPFSINYNFIWWGFFHLQFGNFLLITLSCFIKLTWYFSASGYIVVLLYQFLWLVLNINYYRKDE